MKEFEFRLQNLESSFKAIATQYKTDWKRRAVLNWVARSHDIPKAELRKLFDLWQLTQSNSTNNQTNDGEVAK